MKNRYSISEFFSTAYAYILTKMFYSNARLIRRPVYIRGKKSIDYGKGFTIGHNCRFDLNGEIVTLKIGDNCEFGDYTHIVACNKVEIGNNVLIASKCFISDTNHGVYKGENQSSPYETPNSRKLTFGEVKIGNNVWIGENVVVLAGSEIGDGCVIGANAVVSGKYESNTMIAGIPAKIIKYWNEKNEKWEKYEG